MVIRTVHLVPAINEQRATSWNMTSDPTEDIYVNNEYTDFPGGMFCEL